MLYTLDHLATFSCGQNQGLHHPLDAISKLRLLEKSSGIWTQRMKIKLDKKDLHICSFEDAVSIERFPLSKVVEPTAVVTEDPSEIYNNILMFTVPQESKKKLNPLSEIHLFQCISVSAQEIVDEINRLKSGAKIKKTPKSYYVPPQPFLTGSKSLTNISELFGSPRTPLLGGGARSAAPTPPPPNNIAASFLNLSLGNNHHHHQDQLLYHNPVNSNNPYRGFSYLAGNGNVIRPPAELNPSSGPFKPHPAQSHTYYKSHGDLRSNAALNRENSSAYGKFAAPVLPSMNGHLNGYGLGNGRIPQAHPGPKEPAKDASVYSFSSQQLPTNAHHNNNPYHMQGTNGVDLADGTESVISQQTEHDVMMLNHCFDDIENFISKLQHSHAALKELEKRKAIKKLNKHITGNGMLSLRARPPSEQEFVDIFQKFKLAFNLLARLKNCIHDPNAPELVHFLFRPLEMIVHALKQINYGSSELTHHIVTPLLTNKAIELLRSCLGGKEMDFWYTLGEAWHYPQDHFRGYARSFSPVFQDGWQARYQMSELDKTSEPESYRDTHGPHQKSFTNGGAFNVSRSPLPPLPSHTPNSNHNSNNNNTNNSYYKTSPNNNNNNNAFNYASNINNNNIRAEINNSEHNGDNNGNDKNNNIHYKNNNNNNNNNKKMPNGYGTHQPHQDLNQQNSSKSSAVNANGYAYTRRQYEEEERIEEIPHLNDSNNNMSGSPNYNQNGQISNRFKGLNGGLPNQQNNNAINNNNLSNSKYPNTMPNGIINGETSPYAQIEKKKRFLEFLKDTRCKAYEVMFDRESKNPKELTVHKGEIIQILEDNRNWWKARNHENDIGYVPYTILRPYSFLD